MPYLFVFALGILANWASGHVSLPIGIGIYIAVMGLATYLIARRLRSALVAALMVGILAPIITAVADQLIFRHLTTSNQLGLYIFAMYLVCGTLFVLALALGRRLARPAFDRASDTGHNK